METIRGVITQTKLVLPDAQSIQPVYGGRNGKHTEHLDKLLAEMSEVIRLDPGAEW